MWTSPQPRITLLSSRNNTCTPFSRLWVTRGSTGKHGRNRSRRTTEASLALLQGVPLRTNAEAHGRRQCACTYCSIEKEGSARRYVSRQHWTRTGDLCTALTTPIVAVLMPHLVQRATSNRKAAFNQQGRLLCVGGSCIRHEQCTCRVTHGTDPCGQQITWGPAPGRTFLPSRQK